jgi:hypothetical protein
MSETLFSDNNIFNRERGREMNHHALVPKTIDAIRHPQPFSINYKQN